MISKQLVLNKDHILVLCFVSAEELWDKPHTSTLFSLDKRTVMTNFSTLTYRGSIYL